MDWLAKDAARELTATLAALRHFIIEMVQVITANKHHISRSVVVDLEKVIRATLEHPAWNSSIKKWIATSASSKSTAMEDWIKVLQYCETLERFLAAKEKWELQNKGPLTEVVGGLVKTLAEQRYLHERKNILDKLGCKLRGMKSTSFRLPFNALIDGRLVVNVVGLRH
jgi:hypothetical protein